jgi:hypothetical protein
VNISNGGTVTAITRTAGGSGYTGIPSVATSAPTTAGGVQAVISITSMGINSIAVASGGSGYTLNDVLTVTGGVGTALVVTVSAVSGGVVTGVTYSSGGVYSTLPGSPSATSGGTGSGCTLTILYFVQALSVGTAGSGYVEQPTVTFSGGGGSGAAAFATVGAGSVIRALGTTGTQALDFHTAASATNTVPVLRLRDVNTTGGANSGFVQIQNNNGYASIVAQGPATTHLNIASNGDGRINFNTRSTTEVTQMRVSDTASAVNFVQVTGAATGSGPIISAQGSDTNAELRFQSKGTGSVNVLEGGGFNSLRVLQRAASGDTWIDIQRNVGFVDFIAASGVTDGDIRLTPKGAGNVRFGTYTGTALSIAGYIEIKDAGGTIRRLAVVA